ncbi:hypothetical protein TNCV_1740021 [Trichonephila clavipes]|nr:hypothetical protein TNCV_1740021 [Trichonephila clavipes]
MDMTFDNFLDMDPRTPTRPSTPTPIKICSRLQQLAEEVDQYSTFHRRCAESLWNLRLRQPLCKGAPQQLLRVHRYASSSGEFSSLSFVSLMAAHMIFSLVPQL